MSILLKNGFVYPMDDKTEPGIYDILIEGQKIAAVGKDMESESARIIDCHGKVIIPGLIDAHCHMGLFGTAMGERGVDGNEVTSANTPELRGIDGLNPYDPEFQHAYEHGVTCVCTGPGSANAICGQFVTLKTFGKSLKQMIVQEPAAMKMAFGENPKTAHKGAVPVTRMGTAAIIRETLFKAQRYRDDKQSALDADQPLPPFDMKLEALLPVLAGEVPVKAHAHRADDILTAIRIGDEFQLDMTIEHCSEGHLIPDELSSARGVIIGPLLGFPHKLEVMNQTPAAGCVFEDKGVSFAIMSDLPASHSSDIVYAAGACVREGLSKASALKAITITAAQLLGVDERLGSIECGKDADIAVFTKMPVEYLDARCEMTMIDGQIVYDAMEVC